MALVPAAVFCSNCGAPQLIYEAESDPAAGGPGAKAENHGEIEWKQAVGAAVTFAVPIGVLCSSIIPALSTGCCLWVVGGTVAAVGLYQRRSSSRLIRRPAGIRIGAVIGLLSAVIAAAFNALSLVLQRYIFHNGEAMEKAFQSSMEQGSLLAMQLYSAAPAQAHDAMKYWLSPDGRAAATLLTVLMSSAGIVAFSMIGGALGTRIFSGRNQSARSS